MFWTGAALAQERAASDPKVQVEQLQQLRKEVDELRSRLVDAEARAAQSEQLLDQLGQLNEQVTALRTRLGEALAQADQRALERRAAIETVVAVQQQLISGDTTDATARLAAAEQILPPLARARVEAARHAIENRDLANARWYLFLAAYEAQEGR